MNRCTMFTYSLAVAAAMSLLWLGNADIERKRAELDMVEEGDMIEFRTGEMVFVLELDREARNLRGTSNKRVFSVSIGWGDDPKSIIDIMSIKRIIFKNDPSYESRVVGSLGEIMERMQRELVQELGVELQ